MPEDLLDMNDNERKKEGQNGAQLSVKNNQTGKKTCLMSGIRTSRKTQRSLRMSRPNSGIRNKGKLVKTVQEFKALGRPAVTFSTVAH